TFLRLMLMAHSSLFRAANVTGQDHGVSLQQANERELLTSNAIPLRAPSLHLVDWRQINQFGLITVRTFSVPRSELPADVAGYEIDGEQVGNGTKPPIFVERNQLRVRHARTQLAHALLGHLPVANELGISLEDGLRKEFVAWDLNPKLAFQAKHDVQE